MTPEQAEEKYQQLACARLLIAQWRALVNMKKALRNILDHRKVLECTGDKEREPELNRAYSETLKEMEHVRIQLAEYSIEVDDNGN